MNLVQAVYLNHAYEPLANETVRKALCYALDREQVFDVVADGHGTAVGSSMYPNFRKYFLPELADLYPHDTEKAKAMLAEAGYPDGFDLTITVPSNYQPHMDTAQVVAEQLRAIGVNVTIDPVEWASWIENVWPRPPRTFTFRTSRTSSPCVRVSPATCSTRSTPST